MLKDIQVEPDYNTTTFDQAHAALNRMRRAHLRGTGCHLSAEMVEALSVTLIGELWEQQDPRKAEGEQSKCGQLPSAQFVDNASGKL